MFDCSSVAVFKTLVAGKIGNKAKHLIAPLIYQNTMTSSLFETWFKRMLLPCLDNHSKQTGKPYYNNLCHNNCFFAPKSKIIFINIIGFTIR